MERRKLETKKTTKDSEGGRCRSLLLFPRRFLFLPLLLFFCSRGQPISPARGVLGARSDPLPRRRARWTTTPCNARGNEFADCSDRGEEREGKEGEKSLLSLICFVVVSVGSVRSFVAAVVVVTAGKKKRRARSLLAATANEKKELPQPSFFMLFSFFFSYFFLFFLFLSFFLISLFLSFFFFPSFFSPPEFKKSNRTNK